MAVLVNTSTVPPNERFDLWADVSAQVFEPLALRARNRRAFSASLLRHQLGPLTVDHMSADASVATRTPALIRRDDPDQVTVLVQLEGSCFIAQDGRDAALQPGDLTLWVSSRPFAIGGHEPFEVLMVRLPQTLLRSQAGLIARRTAARIDAGDGVAALLRTYLVQLIAGLDGGLLAAPSHSHLARGVIELIGALSTDAARPPVHDLTGAINAYIDRHLFDVSLTPERIAREHFISRRYLDKLFASQGHSVRRTILERRLEACRHDLADPAFTDLSIFEIAIRWGFTSASHFSNAFRAAYGVSPSEHRTATRATH